MFSKSAVKITLASITAGLLLSGCAAVVVGGAAGAAHDRRSVGTQIDDQGIELSARTRIYQEDDIDRDDHIKVTSYNGVVLLVGETTSASNKDLAGKVAGETKGVRRVVNELRVQEKTGIGTRVDDSILTTRVNTALLTKNPIPGFDPARINVVTVEDTVYLMGLVSREESDNVVEVVRNMRGVAKVVKVFDYSD